MAEIYKCHFPFTVSILLSRHYFLKTYFIIGMVEQMMQMARLKYGNQAGCYIYPKLLSDIAGIDMHVDGWENWNYNLEHVEGSAVIVHKNRPAKK